MPFNRRYVTISGFLRGVTYKQNTEDVVERFMVSIDHIAFLGQPGYQGNPTTIPNTLDTPSKTPRNGKCLINYKRGESTTLITTMVLPVMPATPTPTQCPPQKRQRVEADQSSDSSSSDIYANEMSPDAT